jgi:hypothetical protein
MSPGLPGRENRSGREERNRNGNDERVAPADFPGETIDPSTDDIACAHN